jgi:hypothetical protein
VQATDLDEESKQRDKHGAADHHRPVAEIETKNPALSRRNCELGHLLRPVFEAYPVTLSLGATGKGSIAGLILVGL